MTTTFNSAKKFIALLGLTFLLPALTLADTITVDTFSDDFDEEAPCSLREAVASANNDSPVGGCTAGNGADTIVLAAGEYVLSIACDYDIDEVSADGGYDWGVQCSDLDVTETLTITGAGKTSTTINVSPIQDTGEGNYNNFRAFDLKTQELMAEGQPQCDPSCVEGNVLTLNGMTITGGADNRGGAVRIDSNSCQISKLVTSNVLFSDNDGFSDGGALYIEGVLSSSDSSYEGNEAGDNGGAVYIDSVRHCELDNSITNSTFTGNFSYEGAGGALYLASGTAADVAGSTFTGNNASEYGGAIGATVTELNVTDSTISGNGVPPMNLTLGGGYYYGSPLFGGGIGVGSARFGKNGYGHEYGNAVLTIFNTTISGNQAVYGGGGVATFDRFAFHKDLFLSSGGFKSGITVDSNIRGSSIVNNFAGITLPQVGSTEENAIPFLLEQFVGGGIMNAAFGKAVIEDTTIDGNSAAIGGGIANTTQLEMVQSAVTNNTSTIPGFGFPVGGASSQADEEEDTTYLAIGITGGAGVFNSGSSQINNTTISGNKTDGSGAGVLNSLSKVYALVYHFNQQPEPEIEPDGEVEQPEETPLVLGEPGARLNNVTVHKNEIVALPEPDFGNTNFPSGDVENVLLNNGGGITTYYGKITLANTIVAGNLDAQEILFDEEEELPTPAANADPVAYFGNFAPDCYEFPTNMTCTDDFTAFCELFTPEIKSAQYNLVGTNQGCTPFQPAANSNNDLVGTEEAPLDPKLSALANNGGQTKSHLPQQGSQAIDHANPGAVEVLNVAGVESPGPEPTPGNIPTAEPTATPVIAGPLPCLADDQRGVLRPIDGDLNGQSVCDIGSIEVIVDCFGVPGGSAQKDACGVCGGNGSSCIPVPTATPTTVPDIQAVCKEQNIESTLFVMDGASQSLAKLAGELSHVLSSKGGGKNAAREAAKAADKLHQLAWTSTWALPVIIKSDCTGVLCVSVSNEPLRSTYTSLVDQLFKLNQDLIKKVKRLGVKKAGIKKFEKKNNTAYTLALGSVGAVPNVTTNCQ